MYDIRLGRNLFRPAGALGRKLGEDSSPVDGSETLRAELYAYILWTGVAGNASTRTVAE